MSTSRFDVTAFGADPANDDAANADAFNRAFDAALKSAASSVMVPAGEYRIQGLSRRIVGQLALLGDGGNATQLLFTTPGDGLSFDLSGGAYRFLNSVELEGISLLAACPTGPSGSPLVLDYGNGAGTAAETNAGSAVRRVRVGSPMVGEYQQLWPLAGWTRGPVFNACCHLTVEDLYACGSGGDQFPKAAGAGSGPAMTLNSCVNCDLSNVQLSQWSGPITLGNAGGGLIDCQGIFFSRIRGVDMGSLLRAVGTIVSPPTGLSGITLTDWMLDDGFDGGTYQGALYFENCSDVKVTGGWAQFANGGPLVTIKNCAGVKLAQNKLMLDLRQKSPAVLLTGGTCDSFVDGGNTIFAPVGIQVDLGSTNNTIDGNCLRGCTVPIQNLDPTTVLGRNS